MRELCKAGGTVVAAVVAVLEKQQEALITSPRYNNNNNNQQNHHHSPHPATTPVTSTGTRKESKNTQQHQQYSRSCSSSIGTSDADEKFESAVKDFDTIAEDVERIVQQTNSLKRCKNTESKTDINEIFLETRNSNEEDACDDNVLETSGCVYLSSGNGKRRAAAASSSLNQVQVQTLDSASSDGLVGFSSSDDDETSSSESDSDSEREHVIACEGVLPTIAEEDRVTPSSSLSYKGLQEDEEEESSPEDDSTLKEHNIGWTLASHGSSSSSSTSDLSSTSSDQNRNFHTQSDSSMRCTNDFQWIRKEPAMKEQEVAAAKPPPVGGGRAKKPSAPGSLDRRRHPNQSRQERDQKSRSSHVLKSPPPRLDDFAPCQNWCCSPHENIYFDNFHRRHERLDPQRYGSSPMLMERGSHPDLYSEGRYRHHEQMMAGCCSYHMAPPPPCYYYGDRGGYHWTPSPAPYLKPPNEQDERFRKLQYEKDNLQLQVQVLTEQIEAQSDKINDLEKILTDKKQLLSETEDKFQREVLSRSSLETQKLELMSILSELKLQQASLERENLELRSQFNNNGDIKKPPLMPRISQTSTPIHSSQSMRMTPSPSPVVLSGSSGRLESSGDHPKTPKTPPANYKRQIDIHYGSLPRQQFISNGSGISVVDSNANPAKKGVAFGRGLSSLIMGRARGYSVPNLAETEKILIDDGASVCDGPQSPTAANKNKGIKKIFGKMKRSGSGNLEELPGIGEFQRGGVRATAAARLGWSEPQLTIKPDKPFAEWDTENICDWLQDLGLDQYITEAKRWVKNGTQLQEASISEIEKELNVKNPLHKKKLQLALIDTQENGSSDPYLTQAGQLDTAWVLRWLDDTGLPQHKENFLINRVDGRVLHRLTVDDLHLLHITSLLHVASIKRGIQVLRENNYEPGCLQRRTLPDDPQIPNPKQISLWTTHRVMDWLRAVDLAEYAPNLRGAGVHGGLMVHETRFTVELLASLLSIPPEKTLLRRHLQTRFNELLGKEIIQEKREAESTMGYVPLTPSSKLKVAKKSQFSLKRKKSKGEADYGDLVCPLHADKQSDDEDGKPRGRGCLSSR